MYADTGLENWKFVNQSPAAISKMLFWMINGTEYHKSSYNNSVLKLIDEYSPKPNSRTIRTKGDMESGYFYGRDRALAYSTLIAKYLKGKRIPVCTIFDDIIEWVGETPEIIEDGLYLIKKFIVRGVPFDTMLIDHNILELLVKLGISVEITGYIKTHEYNDGTLLSNFIEQTAELLYSFDTNLFKMIINSHTGTYNRKYDQSSSAYITNSFETLCLAIEEGMCLEPFSYTEDGVEKQMVICKSGSRKRIDEDHCLVYNSIIGCGIVGLIEMINGLPAVAEVLGTNTDAVYYKMPHQTEDFVVDRTTLGSIAEQPLKCSEGEFRNKGILNKSFREEFKFNCKKWNTVNTLNNFVRVALLMMGGIGKTYNTLDYTIKNGLNFVGVSHSNAAVENMRDTALKYFEYEGQFYTLCKLLGLNEKGVKINDGIDINKFDCIIIDEFLTTPKRIVELLYFKLRGYNGKIVCMGHNAQNSYILEHGFKYEYTKCDFFGELCGYTRYEREIDVSKSRYVNNKTIQLLKYFERYGMLPDWFKPNTIDVELKSNICYLNKTRKNINGLFSKKIKVGDRIKTIHAGNGYFKGQRMTCEKIERVGTEMIVNGVYLLKHLDLAYCNTAHENQGMTIDEHTNIYDWNIMSNNQRYTALSRMTDCKFIHLPKGYRNNVSRSDYNNELITPEPVKVCKAFIYELSENGLYYIGFSSRDPTLNERYTEHITDKDCIVYKRMVEPRMKILCNVVGTIRYIKSIEKQYIVMYADTHTDKLINLIKFISDRKIRLPVINEMKSSIIKKPVLRIDKNGYILSWYNNVGIYKRKPFTFKNDNTKALVKVMKYIAEKFEGEYIDKTHDTKTEPMARERRIIRNTPTKTEIDYGYCSEEEPLSDGEE